MASITNRNAKICMVAILGMCGVAVVRNFHGSISMGRMGAISSRHEAGFEPPALIHRTRDKKVKKGLSTSSVVTLKKIIQSNGTMGAGSNIQREIPEGISAPVGINRGKEKQQPKATQESTRSKSKPLNVLVLYPDDWRHDTIGKENSIVQTPFLDSLADQGIRFRQNAVTTSICWISRATFFSGQWLSRHHSQKLQCPHFAAGYIWKESSWPAILQKHGYYTGHVVRLYFWCLRIIGNFFCTRVSHRFLYVIHTGKVAVQKQYGRSL